MCPFVRILYIWVSALQFVSFTLQAADVGRCLSFNLTYLRYITYFLVHTLTLTLPIFLPRHVLNRNVSSNRFFALADSYPYYLGTSENWLFWAELKKTLKRNHYSEFRFFALSLSMIFKMSLIESNSNVTSSCESWSCWYFGSKGFWFH